MELKLYNTLTRQKEVFEPLDPARVRMYVCGPTVYDRAHIGNARPVIVFDVLFRLLRHLYGPDHVTYVRNITDIDDKINARAAERRISIGELTKTTFEWFKEDVKALGCLEPTHEPRATEYIEPMKDLIERLVKLGNAYVAEEHVLFNVPSMKDYGKLSHRSTDDMLAGARVEVAPYKRDPMDFVLWKPSKAGEPAWSSPAGIKTPGRPGWHIECSAMSWKHLGETFDIHGGGIDLVFPHHENELAQSRCAFGTKLMAQTWMHNGFVQMEGEKMAKSEGNVVNIRDLLRGWNGMPWTGSAIRLAMLGTHYRQPIDWTLQRLKEARLELHAFAEAADVYEFAVKENYDDLWSDEPKPTPDILETLCDDLNTPETLAVLRKRMKNLGKSDDVARAEFISNLRFLGVLRKEALRAFRLSVGGRDFSGVPVDILNNAMGIAWSLKTYVANNDAQMIEKGREQLAQLKSGVEISPMGQVQVWYKGPPAKTVDELIEARDAARKAKDFKGSDHIRDELAAMGVVLKDNKDGTTTWEFAR